MSNMYIIFLDYIKKKYFNYLTALKYMSNYSTEITHVFFCIFLLYREKLKTYFFIP